MPLNHKADTVAAAVRSCCRAAGYGANCPQACRSLQQPVGGNRYDDIYSRLENWLMAYIDGLGAASEGCRQAFELKRLHSLKVVEESMTIGRGLDLDAPALFLARVIGLLHDVGRFEQFKRYGTFNDFVSIDHGDLGERTIASNGILEGVDPAQREIITKSIRYHNKKQLPRNEPEAVLFHTRLIRDADKLDIYRVVSERAAVPGTLPPGGTISEALIADLMAGRTVGYERLKNAAEMRLMHINWIFDINFEPTLHLIRERDYLNRLSAALPDTDRLRAFVRQAGDRLRSGVPPTAS